MALFERNSTREKREQLAFDGWLASVGVEYARADLAEATAAGDAERMSSTALRILGLYEKLSRIEHADPAALARQEREEASIERIRSRMYDPKPGIDYSDS